MANDDYQLPISLPLPSDPNPIDWSMVVIRHRDATTDECSIFPPTAHENLQISPHSHSQQPPIPIPQSPPPPSSSTSSSSDSSYSFSPSDFDACGDDVPCSATPPPPPLGSHVGMRGDFVSWMTIGLGVLRSRLLSLASSFRAGGGSPRRGAFWSFWVPAAVAVMSCWIVMAKRKRKSLTQNETRLLDIINEKNAIITQLLHQIAQMNEILISRHKALGAKVTQ